MSLDRESLAGALYKQLKERVMYSLLAPGEVLIPREITEELGVSQTPVREALLQLASEGILSTGRGKSVCVPRRSRVELEELRKIRLVLERMATEEAVPHLTNEDITRLEQLHLAMQEAKRQGLREPTTRANFEFHFLIYRAAGMPRLLSIIENVWAQSGPSLQYLYTAPFVVLPGRHAHVRLLEALKRRDVAEAVAAIEQDIRDYGEALMMRVPE